MAVELTKLFGSVSTIQQAAAAFADEERSRAIFEAMVWPAGPVCPRCGSVRIYRLRDRDMGGTVRPGLRQCAEPECGYHFTATCKTPLHSTKLSIGKWLMGMWVILQSDKGISSVRLAEILGISQQAAWRMGHAIRLMTASAKRLTGTVEFDVMMVGGKPRKDPSNPEGRKGKQGHTTKTPVAVAVERPNSRGCDDDQGPKVLAMPVTDQSAATLTAALSTMADSNAHIMSDQAPAIACAASDNIAHDTVNHSATEYVRGVVHSNSAEGFNDRVRRTVNGVFHHISTKHVAGYLDEISWRWRQRVHVGKAPRQTKKGRTVLRDIWERVPPIVQVAKLLRDARGREMRRTAKGSVVVLKCEPAFG